MVKLYLEHIIIKMIDKELMMKQGEQLPAGSYYYVVEVPETGKVKAGCI